MKIKYECQNCLGFGIVDENFAKLIKKGMSCNCGGVLKEVAQ